MRNGRRFSFIRFFRGAIGIFGLCAAPVSAGGNYGAYPTYHEVDSTIRALQSAYPGIVKVRSLAVKSYQGRDLFLATVSKTPQDTQSGRPEALISGVQHGDEPIGAFMSLFDLRHLCANYATDPEIAWLVNNRQIHFIPVMNPDRYVWNERFAGASYASRRRKTMHLVGTTDSALGGVDPNRNYPYKFAYDNTGSSATVTASNYRGPSALSEPETQAMVNFIAAHRIRTWQNYHNSGDYLIMPYGYRGATAPRYPADSSVYFAICNEQKKYYKYVRTGNSADCYGSWFTNGGSDDWGTADSIQYGKNYKVYRVIPEIGADASNYWPFWNNAAALGRKADSLLRCDLYMIQCAGFFPVLAAFTVSDSLTGNNDRILDPGETVRITTRIENKSIVDTTPAVTAVLSTAYAGCTVTDSLGSFGDVKLLTTVAQAIADPFVVSCKTTASPGDVIRFSLSVRWRMNGIDFVKALPCSLRVGTHVGVLGSKGVESRLSGIENVILRSGNTKKEISFSREGLAEDFRPEFRIFNASGKMISAQYPVGSSKHVYVMNPSGGTLNPGLYFVRVMGDSRTLASAWMVIAE